MSRFDVLMVGDRYTTFGDRLKSVIDASTVSDRFGGKSHLEAGGGRLCVSPEVLNASAATVGLASNFDDDRHNV